MDWKRLINKDIFIVLKKGNTKFAGKIKNIDNSPKKFSWIILIDKSGKEQIICSEEVSRVEVLE